MNADGNEWTQNSQIFWSIASRRSTFLKQGQEKARQGETATTQESKQGEIKRKKGEQRHIRTADGKIVRVPMPKMPRRLVCVCMSRKPRKRFTTERRPNRSPTFRATTSVKPRIGAPSIPREQSTGPQIARLVMHGTTRHRRARIEAPRLPNVMSLRIQKYQMPFA